MSLSYSIYILLIDLNLLSYSYPLNGLIAYYLNGLIIYPYLLYY